MLIDGRSTLRNILTKWMCPPFRKQCQKFLVECISVARVEWQLETFIAAKLQG